MNINASGGSALILAALVCFAGPSQAAAGADGATAAQTSDSTAAPVTLPRHARHSSRSWKKHAARRSSKIVPKSDDKSPNTAEQSNRSPAIPPAVANANAEWQYADTPTAIAAKAMSARATNILLAAAQPEPDTQIVSADQLNDLDRALHPSSPPASTPPAATLSMAAAEAAAPPPASAAAANSDSAWDQTSLIGKIFIGFGALLTMASAARMFIA